MEFTEESNPEEWIDIDDLLKELEEEVEKDDKTVIEGDK